MASVRGSQLSGAARELFDPAWQMRWRVPELALMLSDRAIAHARQTGDQALRLRAEALALFASNRLERGVFVTERAIAAFRDAESAGDVEALAELRTELACCARSSGSYEVALRALRPVLEQERIAPSVRAHALTELAAALSSHNQSFGRTRALDEAERLYSGATDLDRDTSRLSRARVRALRACQHRRDSEVTAAVEIAESGLALLSQLDDPAAESGEVHARLVLERVHALLDRGDQAKAVRAAEPVLSQPVRAASAAPVGWLRLALASRVHLPEGARGTAVRLLNDAVASAERHDLGSLLAEALGTLSHVYESGHDLVEALRSVRGAYAADRRWRASVQSARVRLLEEFPAAPVGPVTPVGTATSISAATPAGNAAAVGASAADAPSHVGTAAHSRPPAHGALASEQGGEAAESSTLAGQSAGPSWERPVSVQETAVPAQDSGQARHHTEVARDLSSDSPLHTSPSRPLAAREDTGAAGRKHSRLEREGISPRNEVASPPSPEKPFPEKVGQGLANSHNRSVPDTERVEQEQPAGSAAKRSAPTAAAKNSVDQYQFGGEDVRDAARRLMETLTSRGAARTSDALPTENSEAVEQVPSRTGRRRAKPDRAADQSAAVSAGSPSASQPASSWEPAAEVGYRSDSLTFFGREPDRVEHEPFTTASLSSGDGHGTSYAATSAGPRAGTTAENVHQDFPRRDFAEAAPIGDYSEQRYSEPRISGPKSSAPAGSARGSSPQGLSGQEDSGSERSAPSYRAGGEHRLTTVERSLSADSPTADSVAGADRSVGLPEARPSEPAAPDVTTIMPVIAVPPKSDPPVRETPTHESSTMGWPQHEQPQHEAGHADPYVASESTRQQHPSAEHGMSDSGEDAYEAGRRSRGKSLAEIRASLRLVQDSSASADAPTRAAPEASARHDNQLAQGRFGRGDGLDSIESPRPAPEEAEPAAEMLARHHESTEDAPGGNDAEPEESESGDTGLADLLAEALKAYESGRRDPISPAADGSEHRKARHSSGVSGITGREAAASRESSRSTEDTTGSPAVARHRRAAMDSAIGSPRSWTPRAT